MHFLQLLPTTLFLILMTTGLRAQVNYADSIQQVNHWIDIGEYGQAYFEARRLEATIPPTDSSYLDVVDLSVQLATAIEKFLRLDEQYAEALPYARAITKLIRKNPGKLGANYEKRVPFSIKNQLVNSFGMEDLERADSLRGVLYEMQAEGKLFEGLDEFFNYDFFRYDSLNIWGYEWFAELPEDRYGSSFTKVVYYVYSTDEEGQDKDQLYRLHVLMYHGDNENFDYVLTLYRGEARQTLYCYYYKEDIDYVKLRNDVKAVLSGDFQPCIKTDGKE